MNVANHPAAPHELLGLPADERDPVRIVAAAAARLRAIRSGGGGDREVRDALVAAIRRARDTLLRSACGS